MQSTPIHSLLSINSPTTQNHTTTSTLTPNQEEEIIIKCSLDEMVRQFFKEYVIVWHDPNVNSPENQRCLSQFKNLCEVKTFTEWNKASEYITKTNIFSHVITSGTNGELFVKEIFQVQQVSEIYVFCRNKDYHSTWAKKYKKVSTIETDLMSILHLISKNLLKWYKQESSLKINLPAFAPIFNDGDKSEINHLHRYLKVVPKFENRLQAKKDILDLSRAIYSDKLIKVFDESYTQYNKKEILNWYTQESFLYKVTNNCLRIATADSIQYCRLLLKDIEQAIKQQYQKKSKHFYGLLYRGAYLSEKEWSSLKENINQEIEMHGFLSVSKEEKISLNFMNTDPDKKVFITIIVPKGPNEEEQGFAEVEEFSRYPQEKEILFNVRSRFTVLEAEDQCFEELPYRHLVLLYGAQGFRKYMAEHNPIIEISIKDSRLVSCSHCKVKDDVKMFFVSLVENKTPEYFCKKCLPKADNTPLLCIPRGQKECKIKIRGFIMIYPNLQIPFYGYRCHKCQQSKQGSFYYKCVTCNGGREKYCQDCFEILDNACMNNEEHIIILERNPFNFWSEEMSEKELNHVRFQSDLIKRSDHIFRQASMYFETHQYQKASEYYNTYIQRNEKEQDLYLSSSYHNIGNVLNKQGEYESALEFYSKSLEINKSAPEGSDILVAGSYKNMGSVYNNQGDYEKALEFYSKSLELEKLVSSEDHPGIATSFNNIGTVYFSQGEYDKALEYFFKALKIDQSFHRDNHPDLAIAFYNIAKVYDSQREYDKALEYFSKSLEIRKGAYGDNHPDVALSYHKIGSVYNAKEEYPKAIEYYLKALEIERLLYGEDHPDVAASYNIIGTVYFVQEEYKKALEYFLISMEIYKLVYGENHAEVVISYNNIGAAYQSQEDYEKALESFSKCFEICKLVHGDSDPYTLNIQDQIQEIHAIIENKKDIDSP